MAHNIEDAQMPRRHDVNDVNDMNDISTSLCQPQVLPMPVTAGGRS
jgi:hypothetical protein